MKAYGSMLIRFLTQPFPVLRHKWKVILLVDLCVFMVHTILLLLLITIHTYHIVMILCCLTVVSISTYLSMLMMSTIVHPDNWTVWKYIVCAFIDIVAVTTGYLFLEVFFKTTYGTYFHLYMREGYSFSSNIVHVFLLNFVVGIVIGVLIYFFMKSSVLSELLREKELLDKHLSSQKNRMERTSGEEESINLSGRTKDLLMLKPSHLLYMVASGNYVEVYFLDENKKVIRKIIRTTIQQMEEELKTYSAIIRCHRAYIVNISFVEKINTSQHRLLLYIKTVDKEVPVSRTYRRNFSSLT